MNIIEMDKQATYDLKDEFGNWIGHGFDKEKFAELVAAHEREECAKVCDEAAIKLLSNGKARVNQVDRHTAEVLCDKAKTIRARSKA